MQIRLALEQISDGKEVDISKLNRIFVYAIYLIA